jgi:DNA adenine methylase
MKPLFMWAGGKTRLIKKYKERGVLPHTIEHYVEPFMGAGAMFVWAYNRNKNATFVLNDYNQYIMSIYRTIRGDCNNFLAKMDELESEYLPLNNKNEVVYYRLTKPNKERIGGERKKFYYNLLDEYIHHHKQWGRTEEDAVLYFLLKTGFNGIWQTTQESGDRYATPSGLLNHSKKVYDRNNVLEWQKALKNTTLLAGDFGKVLPYVKKNSYVFLDPPYRGSFTQYGVDFDDTWQEHVIKFLNDSTKLGAYAMLSNRVVEDEEDDFFESRRDKNEIIYFDVTYTAGRRKQAGVDEEGNTIFEAKKAREILMIGKK